jgi:dUTP pyrophosphatase
VIPVRATAGSAGYDLYSVENDFSIKPGTIYKCGTGISLNFPKDHYGRIAPRSSLGVKGIHVLGGVIDSDYRGEIIVLLYRLPLVMTIPADVMVIKKGDRIAQLIFEKVSLPVLVEYKEEDNRFTNDCTVGESNERSEYPNSDDFMVDGDETLSIRGLVTLAAREDKRVGGFGSTGR